MRVRACTRPRVRVRVRACAQPVRSYRLRRYERHVTKRRRPRAANQRSWHAGGGPVRSPTVEPDARRVLRWAARTSPFATLGENPQHACFAERDRWARAPGHMHSCAPATHPVDEPADLGKQVTWPRCPRCPTIRGSTLGSPSVCAPYGALMRGKEHTHKRALYRPFFCLGHLGHMGH